MRQIKNIKEVRIRYICPNCDKDNWAFVSDLKPPARQKARCIYCKHDFTWFIQMLSEDKNAKKNV